MPVIAWLLVALIALLPTVAAAMPPAVAAVAAAAVGGITVTGTFVTGLTLGFSFTAAAVAGVGSLALGFVTQALTPKPKGADAGSGGFVAQSRDRTLAIRQPIVTGKLHFGRLRISGAQTFIETTGSGNGTLHLLVTLSVNRLERLEELWINDEQVPLDWAFGAGIGGNATGKYAGKVKAWFGDGTVSGDATLQAALTAAVGSGDWSSDHKQRGCGKLYVQLVWDEGLFGGGLPNVSCVARCSPEIYDPRDSGTRWTDNWALVVARYLTIAQASGGFGDAWAEIDETALIASANASDEMVDVATKSTTFTAVAADDALTLAAGTARLRTGSRVRVSTTGTLPGGLAAATDYFVCELGTLRIGLATSLANARARTLIDITSAGSGTHTITANAEPRYTANGTIDTGDEPEDVLAKLLTAGAGKLVRVQGKWEIRAGVWSPSVQTLGEDDLASGFSVAWRREPREAFNGVKGTFVDPDSAWQPTDFPAVQVAGYLAEDQGIAAWRDAELPYTVSPSMAQRIARIDLERIRRQISTKWVCKLTTLGIAAGDTVALDYARYGWSGKTFECGSFKLAPADGGAGLVVELGLAEIDANVFAWDPADEVDLPPSPRTNLPSPSTVAAPTSLVLTSGTTELDMRTDGTVFSRLKASWTAPADAFVTGGGLIELQVKKSADADWQPSEITRGDATFYRFLDVADGVAYDVRVRARNYLGVVSSWVTETDHVVVGKTAPPENVTGFSAAANGAAVLLRWSPVGDFDLDGYDLRFSALGISAWDAATPLSQATGATSVTSVAVPPGTWRFYCKARDTSGNLSATAATAEATIGAISVDGATVVVFTAEQAPDWIGTKTGCHVHWTGALIPDGTELAADMTDAELWDEFNAYPVAEAVYEAPEIDVGFDAAVRTYAATAAALGPGETTGNAVAFLEQDYKLAAGIYDGFEPWTIGTNVLRYFKQKITLRASDGAQFATAFAPVVDATSRTESGTNVAVASGGTAIVFAQRFFEIPNIQATAVDGTAQQAWAESVTETGFTLRTATGAGTPVAGTANWTATGV